MNIFVGRALIVEDESAIAQLLKIHLIELGLTVDVVPDAETALMSLQTINYSLCLLDWMLPGMQGIDLLKKIRQTKKQIKILMLTAKTDSESIVTAIEAGADDYLTKPFDYKVLLARARNLLRRLDFENEMSQLSEVEESSAANLNQISLDGLSIHFLKYTISLNDESVHLTPSEFKLLASLLKAQGQVLTRDQLILQIQGDDVNVTGRTVDTHIFTLRKKLGEWAEHIETIRGVGYRILILKQDGTMDPNDEVLKL